MTRAGKEYVPVGWTEYEWEGHLALRALHNPFCSRGGPLPCPCESWSKCAADVFPNLVGACPALCPVHGEVDTPAEEK